MTELDGQKIEKSERLKAAQQKEKAEKSVLDERNVSWDFIDRPNFGQVPCPNFIWSKNFEINEIIKSFEYSKKRERQKQEFELRQIRGEIKTGDEFWNEVEEDTPESRFESKLWLGIQELKPVGPAVNQTVWNQTRPNKFEKSRTGQEKKQF